MHDRRRSPSPGRDRDTATAFLPADAWHGIVRSLRLSRREAEIAALLLTDDNRDGTIAERLAISPHTVHTYLERLYRKLGAASRSQVVTRIFQRYVVLAESDTGDSCPTKYSRQPLVEEHSQEGQEVMRNAFSFVKQENKRNPS